MKGILTRNEDGIWMVKWSDLHSFGHGTHWMFTELSSDSNSIKYIKDNLIMVKPLEEGLEVEFEMVTSGYDENNFTPFYKTKWSPICSGNSIYKEKSDVYDGDMLVIETLPVYKLDDVVIGTYDLIKIDTQGSELDIIQGGINTFSKAKVVICEVALMDVNIGGCKKEDVMNVLTKELKFDYIRVIENILSVDNKQINYENLLFIKP